MRLHLPRSVGNSNSYQLYRTALNLPRGQPGFFLALHTLGEYFDFHPHFHALVADGLVDEAGECHPAPELPTRVLEELLRARIFAQLLRHKLISKELLAKMKTRKHSGFNVHIGRTVATEDRAANVQVESGVFRPMCLGAVGRIPRGAIGENGKTKVAAPRDSTGGGLNLFANNCQPSNLRKCLEYSFFGFFRSVNPYRWQRESLRKMPRLG